MSIRRLTLNISAVFFLSALASGCAYVIPEEQNGPRYNEVIGEIRKPEKNVTIIGPQSAAVPTAPVAAPLATVRVAELPPVVSPAPVVASVPPIVWRPQPYHRAGRRLKTRHSK